MSTKYEVNVVEKTKTYFGGKTVFFKKPLQEGKYNKKWGLLTIQIKSLSLLRATGKV